MSELLRLSLISGLAFAAAWTQAPPVSLGPAGRTGDNYGPPRVVDLDHVVFAPETYQRSHVIVVGTIGPLGRGEYWTLTQGTATVLVIPGYDVSSSDLNPRMGSRVQVRGIVRRIRKKEYARGMDWDLIEDPSLPVLPAPSLDLPKVSITVLEVFDREPLGPRKGKAEETMIYEVLESPATYAGKTVTIRGQFRGRNLFGDLPSVSRRGGDDWVLKDGDRALWVLGKAPRGKGFSLDPSYRGDAVRWLVVSGKPEVANGIVYLRASKVVLSTPPPETADTDAR